MKSVNQEKGRERRAGDCSDIKFNICEAVHTAHNIFSQWTCTRMLFHNKMMKPELSVITVCMTFLQFIVNDGPVFTGTA